MTPPLFIARLSLDGSLTPAQVAGFEMVFSELLDASATAHLRDGVGDWLIESLFVEAPDAAIVADLLAPVFAFCGHVVAATEIAPLEQRDWLAENRAAFPPRRIGRFWIHGSHVETPPPPTSWPLLVEAAQAFGSGTHPTTEGCLRAAEAILRRDRRRGWQVLDMGCGSAILGLGFLRARPAARLVLADNDGVAVRTAAQNARINGLARRQVVPVLSHGYAHPSVRDARPYDLIFANILAGPLCGMARDQMAALAPDGWLILSGILNDQAVMVERRYAGAGARAVSRLRIGEWTTLVMRPAAHPTRLGGLSGLWHPRDRHQTASLQDSR
ncbi:MAG: 50S ribosomal protein L11 methyltransferase [Candidatus Puniceispirillaceae bacterium]